MSGDRVFIGIEIGGTKLQLVAGDASGRVMKRARLAVDPHAGAAGVCRLLEAGITGLLAPLDHAELAGVGVGFGGPVDRRTGRVSRSHQVHGWEDFPLREWIADSTNSRVTLENDSNAAALGEARGGAGAGRDVVFYANFGSGVGGGLVTRGDIYYGAPPGEAEFGHLRLDRSGATVESRCSGWAVDARIRQIAREAEGQGHLATLLGRDSGGEARHLAAALAAGDAIAGRVLEDVAADIGFALSHVVHLLHPDVIVLGGGLSLVGEPFRRAVAAALEPHVMAAFRPAPPVALAALGEDVVPVGALHLAIRAATAAEAGHKEGTER